MKIFDSSPLIAILGNLEKPEFLKCFISAGYPLYVPDRVVEEVSLNPEKENLQKMLSKKEITKLNALQKENIQTFRNRHPRLGEGESELILLAQKWKKENKKFCCIIDDALARETAENLGLKCKGTIGMLNKLNELNFIDNAELNFCLKKLEECGFRYSFKK